MSRCEFEACGREATATENGIEVCERCRLEFRSLGFGAVFFGGRWHGVIGATYTAEQCDSHPGLNEDDRPTWPPARRPEDHEEFGGPIDGD